MAFYIFENYVNVASKGNSQNILEQKILVAILKVTTDENNRTRSGSVSQRYGSVDPDPDPYQYVTDPQHWYQVDHRAYQGNSQLGCQNLQPATPDKIEAVLSGFESRIQTSLKIRNGPPKQNEWPTLSSSPKNNTQKN